MTPAPSPRRSRRRPCRADRGEAVLEHVVLVPLVLFLVLLGIQAAVYFHAANLAEHASSRAASIASRSGASEASGVAEATATVQDSGGTLVVASVSGGTEVEALVTVRVNRVLPFFPTTVTRRASEPRERFIPEDER